MPNLLTLRNLAGAAALFMVLVGTEAAAMPVLFGYTGICEEGCSTIGLNANDPVSGMLETREELLADNKLTTEDIASFGFQFGDFAFGESNSTIKAKLSLNARRDGFDRGFISVFDSVANDVLLAFERFDKWVVVDGPSLPPDGALGKGAFKRVSVPEPGTLVLLAVGLMALLLARRTASNRASAIATA